MLEENSLEIADPRQDFIDVIQDRLQSDMTWYHVDRDICFIIILYCRLTACSQCGYYRTSGIYWQASVDKVCTTRGIRGDKISDYIRISTMT
jgi:hypothetical protein